MNIPPWQFQRAYTPDVIKRLLQITALVTLSSIALDIQALFTLSPLFSSSLYFWQPITALFIVPTEHFSFGYMLDFAFLLLVFWLFGSLVADRIGKAQFLVIYFASGILSGLASLYVMHKFQLFSYSSELMPAILAITTVWAMMDPFQEILLFFVLPLKAKWVLVVAMLGTLFLSFVQQDIISFTAYFTAFCFAYFWSLIVLGLRSPFDWMTGLDRLINRAGFAIRRFWQWTVLRPFRTSKAGEEQFVDEALEQISKNGESSLSFYAKLRLKWISFKKRLNSKK